MEDKLLELLLEKTEAGKTTYKDVNEMIDQLKGKLIQKLIDEEFKNHMKYEKGSHEDKKDNNRRNGKGTTKKVKTKEGEIEITTPRDRNGSFEPIIVPKRSKMITDIEDQIILLYSKGNSIENIKDIIKGIYKVQLNDEFISNATKAVNEELIAWKKRPLKEMYPIVYMDCLYTSVRENNVSAKKAVYVSLGIDITGKKDIIGFWCGESESSNFWYGVLEEIKERGVKDILFLCTDGVSGFKEILEEVYPKTKHQRCIVHMIRNMTKCVPRKKWQELCNDLKTIYKAPNRETAISASEEFKEKYANNKLLIKKFENNVESMLDLFDYSRLIRKLIYTTNPIESVNSALRKVTNGKGCFVNKESLEKVLYLRIKDLTEKWNQHSKSGWTEILNELLDIFGKRVENYIEV